MWTVVFAAADDPGTVIPIVGGGSLSAVLFYLLMDSIKERRALQKSYDELLNRMLPTFTAVTVMMERVLEALAKQVDYHATQSDPDVLRRAYEQLRRVLEEHGDEPPPSRTRRRRDP